MEIKELTRTIYSTSDGATFYVREDAINHEAFIKEREDHYRKWEIIKDRVYKMHNFRPTESDPYPPTVVEQNVESVAKLIHYRYKQFKDLIKELEDNGLAKD